MDEGSLESSSVPAKEFGSRRKYAQNTLGAWILKYMYCRDYGEEWASTTALQNHAIDRLQ